MSTTMCTSRARPPAIVTWPTPPTVWITRDDLLVGDLGQRPQAHRVGRDDQRHHRVGIGIDLGDHRRQQLRRHDLHRARRPSRARRSTASLRSRSSTKRTVIVAVPSLMRAEISSMPETPLIASSIGSTTDGRHLVGAGAGQRELDVDRRRVGLREEIDAEIAEREDAEHHERHHQHRGEHGTANAEFRQHVYSTLLSMETLAPSVSLSTSVAATCSPAFTPLRISMRSPRRSPTFSSRTASLSPSTTNTRFTP